MKPFQVHEDENGWGGYLIDKDAEAVISVLGRRAITAEARLDPDIVREAWTKNRTIVTSNGRDFVRHIREFQKRQNNRECRDLWGLLVIPNAQLQRRGLEKVRLGFDIPQLGRLRWPAASFLNLYLHVNVTQRPTIRRFERCSFCEQRPIRKPWDAWYHSLPIVGSVE